MTSPKTIDMILDGIKDTMPENNRAHVPISFGLEKDLEHTDRYIWAAYLQVTNDDFDFEVFADGPEGDPIRALRIALTLLKRQMTLQSK